MANLKIQVDFQKLKWEVSPEQLYSGNIKIDKIEFIFSDEWEGFLKTATFTRQGRQSVIIALDDTNICDIPPEVSADTGAINIGVFGIKGEQRIVSSNLLYYFQEGSKTNGVPSEPTIDIYQQIVNIQEETKEIAQSVRDDADAGKFDGDDYILTEQDKQEIASIASSIKYYICGENEVGEDGKPLIDNPDPAIFYLTPSNEESPNLFYAWAYIDGAWERFEAGLPDLSNYVKNTDYGGPGKAGIVKIDSDGGNSGIFINGSNGMISVKRANHQQIDNRNNEYAPITASSYDYAVKKALSDCKLSGEDAWTLEEQQSAQRLLGGQMIKNIAPDENGEYKVGIDELEIGVYFIPKGAYVYFFRDDERNRLQLYGDSLLIINTMYNDDNSKAFLYLNGTMNGWGSINLSNRRRAYEYIPFGGFVAIGNTQTITGIKTFSTQPKMTAELTEDDNSTNIPTTAWVQALVQKKIEEALQTNV